MDITLKKTPNSLENISVKRISERGRAVICIYDGKLCIWRGKVNDFPKAMEVLLFEVLRQQVNQLTELAEKLKLLQSKVDELDKEAIRKLEDDAIESL